MDGADAVSGAAGDFARAKFPELGQRRLKAELLGIVVRVEYLGLLEDKAGLRVIEAVCFFADVGDRADWSAPGSTDTVH